MPPHRFGRYEVLAEIGDGSMARVYKAWDPAFARLVAVKTLKPELTSGNPAEYLARFRREALAAGALSHPGVVRVFDVGVDYMVMEFVLGRTLRQLLREERRVAPAEVVRLLAPIAEAIDHVHRAGIVHRDIKPANIMVQPDGSTKLMDFGVAHVSSSVITAAGEILGSPAYMAPEQAAGEEATPRSDVYALAIVAYEMLVGRPPFQGSITQVIARAIHEVPAAPSRSNPALATRYDAVLARALDKDPARRFGTASDLVSALDVRAPEALAATRSAGQRRKPAGQPSGIRAKPRSLRARAMTFAATLAVLLGVMSTPVARTTTRTTRPRLPAMSATGAPARRRPASPPASRAPAPTAPAVAARRPRTAINVRLRPVLPRAADTAHRATPAARSATPGSPARDDFVPPRRIAHRVVAPEPRGDEPRTGTVVIRLVVDENGMPTDLAIVESAGPALDEAALASVATWRFKPARRNGVAVRAPLIARQTYVEP